MSLRPCLLVLPLLLVLGPYVTSQDTVKPISGEKILTGRVSGLHLEGVRIQVTGATTPQLVPWSGIADDGLLVTRELVLEFANGDRLTLRVLAWRAGRLRVTREHVGEFTLDVAALAPAPEEAPAAATGAGPGSEEPAPAGPLEPEDWVGKVALLGTFRSGNVDSSLFRLDAEVSRQWAADIFTARGAFAYGETDGETTASSVLGRFKWDHYYSEDFYSYALLEGEWDDVKELNLRVLAGPGAGHRIWKGKRDHQSLNVEAGINVIYEDFQGETAETRAAGRVAITWQDRFFTDLLLTQTVEALIPVPEASAFLLRSITDLSMPISDSWKVNNRIEVEWNGSPADGSEELDLKVLLGLVYTF